MMTKEKNNGLFVFACQIIWVLIYLCVLSYLYIFKSSIVRHSRKHEIKRGARPVAVVPLVPA